MTSLRFWENRGPQLESYSGYSETNGTCSTGSELIFRTTDYGGILFMNGDNYVFPVTYGRVVEKMREDVRVYDRINLIFKMPGVEAYTRKSGKGWEEQRNKMEMKIHEEKEDRAVYYAVFH